MFSKNLTGKPTGRRTLGRPWRRWEDNIRMHVNLLSAHDVISRHAVARTQWPGRLNTSC